MSRELNDKILAIQLELKAPKNQFNNFGKYKYRSCEDILEGVKPLLSKHGLLQTIRDEIKCVGERYYIEAKVIVSDGKNEQLVTAYAREPENKKGMDESQITGTASSYARKYALNGMWLIDDTKDADTDEHQKQKSASKPSLKPDTDKWNKAVDAVASGQYDIAFIKSRYDITKKDSEKLVAEAMQKGQEATK